MEIILGFLFVFNIFLLGYGIPLEEQLKHVIQTRAESSGLLNNDVLPLLTRRVFKIQSDGMGDIVGAPDLPSHLPPSEPILPGHTLLRPAFGMLKSAVKFPHRDPADGAGVYGNIKHILSMTYDGLGERVLYTYFRRMNELQNNEDRKNEIDPLQLNGRRDMKSKMGLFKQKHHRSWNPEENGSLENNSLKKLLVMIRRNQDKLQTNNQLIYTRKYSGMPIILNWDKFNKLPQKNIIEHKDDALRQTEHSATPMCLLPEKAVDWSYILRDRFNDKHIDDTLPTFVEVFPESKGIYLSDQSEDQQKRYSRIGQFNDRSSYTDYKMYSYYTINQDYKDFYTRYPVQ